MRSSVVCFLLVATLVLTNAAPALVINGQRVGDISRRVVAPTATTVFLHCRNLYYACLKKRPENYCWSHYGRCIANYT